MIDEEEEWKKVIFSSLSTCTEKQRRVYMLHTGLHPDGELRRGLGFLDISRLLQGEGEQATRQSVTDRFIIAENHVLRGMLKHSIKRIRRLESER